MDAVGGCEVGRRRPSSADGCASSPDNAERGEEWQYGLFARPTDRLLGSFGLMTRRGPGTLEIGYWLHVDAGGRGYATNAARALTADRRSTCAASTSMIIVCDEANLRSAAIPQRLGYTLDRIEPAPPRHRARAGACRSGSPTAIAARADSPRPERERASSMRAITSASRRAATSSASMFSCTCDARLAPVITVDTCWFFVHHASDELRERAAEVVGDDLQLAHPLVASSGR